MSICRKYQDAGSTQCCRCSRVSGACANPGGEDKDDSRICHGDINCGCERCEGEKLRQCPVCSGLGRIYPSASSCSVTMANETNAYGIDCPQCQAVGIITSEFMETCRELKGDEEAI